MVGHMASKPRRWSPNQLWKYRQRMGFSQRRVADILGYVSPYHISEYERGHKLPSLITALKLEIVYRIPVAFLYPELYKALKERLRAREEQLRAEREGHEAEKASE